MNLNSIFIYKPNKIKFWRFENSYSVTFTYAIIL